MSENQTKTAFQREMEKGEEEGNAAMNAIEKKKAQVIFCIEKLDLKTKPSKQGKKALFFFLFCFS